MKKIHSIVFILLLIIGVNLTSVNYLYGQSVEKKYSSKKLVIGKVYEGKITDSAIATIDKKMEEIKHEVEKFTTINDTIACKFKYETDVNNLKSILLEPTYVYDELIESLKIKELLEVLKKYNYVDVMVSTIFIKQEDADMVANKVAMALYNGGLGKNRIRVNGLPSDLKKEFIFYVNLRLVPSKEMIDKAINGTL